MPRGVVVIQSTQKGDPAHESDALSGAIFTHHLLSALRGAGDQNRDGRVSLEEAYTYTYRKTMKTSAGSSTTLQRPTFDMDLSGNEEFIWTSPDYGQAILELPEGKTARYLIFHQQSGVLLAEAIPSSNRRTALAVRSGRLLIHRHTKNKIQLAEVDLPFGGRYRVRLSEFVEQPHDILSTFREGHYLVPLFWPQE